MLLQLGVDFLHRLQTTPMMMRSVVPPKGICELDSFSGMIASDGKSAMITR